MRCRRSTRTLPRPRKPAAPGFVRQVGDGQWEIRIQRELKTPNRSGLSWQRKREREEWLRALNRAIAEYVGVPTILGIERLTSRLSLFVQPGVKERRRVVIRRLAPSKRRFILDDDNLAFAPKQLLDSMKVAGLLYEDRRKYLDAPRPTQDVSEDGEFWTVIRIERAPVGVAPAPETLGGLL